MELVGRSAIDLAAAVRDGEVTAVEVVQAHLDQLAEVEHRVGAFVSTRRSSALAEARALDERDPDDRAALLLAGVPIAIKDSVDVAGEPTRHGTSLTPDTPAEADDEAVARLRESGAIVIGKTRCPELCVWGTTDDETAITVSPWDEERTAGGSSGGSAAAVTSGIVPLAVGSDGFGSVRIPAAACGAVGFKPGEGRLSAMLGGKPHGFGMTRLGPIATTVADVALATDLMSATENLRRVEPVGPLQIAVSWKTPAPGVVVTSTWRETALEAGRLANHLGHTVTHDDPPYDRASTQALLARWTQGVLADVEHFGIDPDDLQPRTRAHRAAGERMAKLTPVQDDDASRWQGRIAEFLTDYDVLVLPTFARAQPSAVKWQEKPWAANIAANLSAYPFTATWNFADVPALALPIWNDEGKPLSVQLVAGRGREDVVLALAAQLEALVPWQRHAPGWVGQEK